MKVYIVIELSKTDTPKIKGVFKKKHDAEIVAFSNSAAWCNIREEELK